MSKRISWVTSSVSSSSAVSRSTKSVPKPCALIRCATKRFRGLCRLLPLPWAKITSPVVPTGSARSPDSTAPGKTIRTARIMRSPSDFR